MFERLKFGVFGLLATALCAPPADAYTTTRKFHPGHYTVILPAHNSLQKYSDDAIRPGVVGIMKRFTWRELEPQRGVYDFSQIQTALNWAHAYGMQLVVMIDDKTFVLERPNPSYLDTLTPRNRSGGYTMLRWDPTVVDRYKALVAALGASFDSNANFEGIAAQESSLGLDSTALKTYGYTPEKYRDALIDMFTHALAVMPRSRVFWYQNFLVGNNNYIGSVAAALGPKGLVMAGPDTLPDRDSLVDKSYPFFGQFKDKMHLGIQVEGACYRALHETSGYSTKYWTMSELFQYARDTLHVNYMFWVRIPSASPSDAYDWYDALPVIEANPVFNVDGNTQSGGTEVIPEPSQSGDGESGVNAGSAGSGVSSDLDGSKVSSDSGSGGGGSITGFDLCAILALAAFAWFCGRGRYDPKAQLVIARFGSHRFFLRRHGRDWA